jgi:ribosomal protein S18 acetylase RimI-like enzyme
MEIRPVTATDLAALVELNGFLQQHHVDLEPQIYAAVAPGPIETFLQERLADDQWETVVACVAGRTVGYITWQHQTREQTAYTLERNDLYVDQLGVLPSAREKGVGRALMAAAENRARALGCTQVKLDVRAANRIAVNFYAALDYAPSRLSMSRCL